MTIQYKPCRCPECRQVYTPRRIDQSYCSTRCNDAASKRELARARRIYRALYWWRLDRKRDVAANLRFVCQEIASWIKEDREAQRLPPPRHDHMQDRGHQRAKGMTALAMPKKKAA